jgi:hypothetical protein
MRVSSRSLPGAYRILWTVHVDPEDGGEGVWTVDCFSGVQREYDKAPVTPEPPFPRSPRYTLRHRYDVDYLCTEEATAEARRRHIPDHLRVMKTASEADGIYRYASFGDFPLSLQDIADVAQAQVAANYPVTERLEIVMAENISPYTVSDFDTFARVVSTNMVVLHLGSKVLPTSSIKFADLPEILTSVRCLMPNLESLYLTVGGVEHAEAVCGELLTRDILDLRGSLERMTLYIGAYSGPLFNVMRYLHSFCGDNPEVRIATAGQSEEYKRKWDPQSQRKLMKYLRK